MKMFLQCDVSNSVESNKDICHRSSKKGKSGHGKERAGNGGRGLRVEWCNEVFHSNSVDWALTSSANKLLAFVFLSKGFVFSFTCMKTIV